MIGGAILLGAELGFVNAQFYLVFIGSAALVVGLASAAIPGPGAWRTVGPVRDPRGRSRW